MDREISKNFYNSEEWKRVKEHIFIKQLVSLCKLEEEKNVKKNM